MNTQIRLDKYLLIRKIAKSRNQATEMIKKGLVCVNGLVILKQNKLISEADEIKLINNWKYVSRAGYKLEQAINEFRIDFNNKIALDIGASTGGFVDCAIQHNAKKIYALDVGSNQLDKKLLGNAKVINLEKTNLKEIPNLSFDKIDIITCDVSFISIKNVFDSILTIVDRATICIFLIKPQFELDNILVKKMNYSINEKYQQIVINKINNYAYEMGFELTNISKSKTLGAKKANVEYLAIYKFFK